MKVIIACWVFATVFFLIIAAAERVRLQRQVQAQAQVHEALERYTRDFIREAEVAPSGQFVIHTANPECPPGWTFMADAFSLNDRPVPGCVLDKGGSEIRMDYLRPQESKSLDFQIRRAKP